MNQVSTNKRNGIQVSLREQRNLTTLVGGQGSGTASWRECVIQQLGCMQAKGSKVCSGPVVRKRLKCRGK